MLPAMHSGALRVASSGARQMSWSGKRITPVTRVPYRWPHPSSGSPSPGEQPPAGSCRNHHLSHFEIVKKETGHRSAQPTGQHNSTIRWHVPHHTDVLLLHLHGLDDCHPDAQHLFLRRQLLFTCVPKFMAAGAKPRGITPEVLVLCGAWSTCLTGLVIASEQDIAQEPHRRHRRPECQHSALVGGGHDQGAREQGGIRRMK
jgi:hypothetical protein